MSLKFKILLILMFLFLRFCILFADLKLIVSRMSLLNHVGLYSSEKEGEGSVILSFNKISDLVLDVLIMRANDKVGYDRHVFQRCKVMEIDENQAQGQRIAEYEAGEAGMKKKVIKDFHIKGLGGGKFEILVKEFR